MVETFNDRPVEYIENLRHRWPSRMQNVGDSLALAYASNKWKPKDRNGKRELEIYKHLAESRNRALVRRGALHDFYRPNQRWNVRGPMVSLGDCPMPRQYAILGLFEEIDLQLYVGGTNKWPRFGDGRDDGVVKVTFKHAMLAGSYMRWSEVYEDRNDQPFIFVYTRSAGIQVIVVGDELDVKKDGIVG